jgi:acetylxylan esterase
MMTNVLCATYPEIWRAATVYSGVAAGCFVSNTGAVDAWNSSCALGQVDATSAQWASVVRAMFPGYTGAYPPIQEYHGTADTTLFPPNLNEEVKEWSGIFGYNAAAPTQVLQNTPLAGYTKSIYGPSLQGILAQGVGHTVPIQGNEDMKWFGIVAGGAAPPPTTTVATTTPATTPPATTTVVTTTTPPSSTPGTVAEFGQCGGMGSSLENSHHNISDAQLARFRYGVDRRNSLVRLILSSLCESQSEFESLASRRSRARS